jgi:hypothetical protein
MGQSFIHTHADSHVWVFLAVLRGPRLETDDDNADEFSQKGAKKSFVSIVPRIAFRLALGKASLASIHACRTCSGVLMPQIATSTSGGFSFKWRRRAVCLHSFMTSLGLVRPLSFDVTSLKASVYEPIHITLISATVSVYLCDLGIRAIASAGDYPAIAIE